MTGISRVLLVRLSAIGDVIHTMPVASALKRSFPHIQLVWAVEDRCAGLVACHPCVDQVFPLPREAWRARRRSWKTWVEGFRKLRTLRKMHFHLALDMQGLLKSAVVAAFSGAPIRLGYHWQREGSRFLVRGIPARESSTHVVDQYLDVVRYLGGTCEPVDFGLKVPKKALQDSDQLLSSCGVRRPYAVVNPSAGRPTKRWPPASFAAVCDHLAGKGIRPVLVGHRDDMELNHTVRTMAREAVADLAGQTDLVQLLALISKAVLHVAGDTGSLHMAAALGVPVVALYASTDPRRSGPYGQAHRVLSAYRASERTGTLEEISVSEVCDRISTTLEEVGSRA